MRVGIYSLEKVLFEGEAVSVNCNTRVGQITILDHHDSLISILERGIMKIIDKDRAEYYIPVSSGFLEFKNNEGKFLVEEDKPQ